MPDDLSDIAAYYDGDPEREHNRLKQHQLEYDLTWRYLDQYLPSRGSILEVGAGTGKYTLELARRGYSLTCVDLSAHLLDECRRNLANEGLQGQVQLAVGDARDLRGMSDTEFDAVLLMGPLYHLVEEADRTAALKEAFAQLREGGIIFSSFISRFGIMGDVLRNMPDWIDDQTHVRSLLERGRRPDEYPRGGFRGYFAGASEIEPFHEAIGFETLVLAAVEPAISADDESYNMLQGKRRELWLDLLYEISSERSLIAASRHILYIGKKGHKRQQYDAGR
ncbi:MAG: class I SAM-dependent methyltransferase [Dehalococcoidia bacterium]